MPAEVPDNSMPIPPALSLTSEALLTELECWRELVARHLVREDHAITEPALSHAILVTILRVLLVKLGEELGFFGHGTLRNLSASDHIHDRLTVLTEGACTGSPAGVFPEEDPGRAQSPVDDPTLRTIIGRIESFGFPCPVSKIPVQELAGVFERYLGSKIRIMEGYRVQRSIRSAVRDAGSVHIPAHPVIRSIAQETIANLVKGKTPRDVSRVHILDPACGSGIFLLTAYRFLLDWHLDWYRTHLVSILAGKEPMTLDGIHAMASGLPVPNKNHGQEEPDLPVCYRGGGDPTDPGSWTLSPSERRRILTASCFGTDIDRDATEIARFLLMLATLDGSLPGAPDRDGISSWCITAGQLRDTIRCGNALIGPDYFTHRQVHPFNAEERRRVNAFDWQAAYPGILAGGGFNAVIGAPPAHRPFPAKSRDEYFQMHYDVYAKGAGLYGYFIEKGLDLLKQEGVLSFFVPEPFLRAQHARPLRRLLLTTQLEEIVEVGGGGLPAGAATRSYILRIAKKDPVQPFLVSRAQASGFSEAGELTIGSRFAFSQHLLDDGGWTLEDRRAGHLTEKIRAGSAPLEDYVMGQIGQGTVHVHNNPFIIDAGARTRFIKKDWRCKKFFRPLLRPADIRRYQPEKPDRFVIAVKDIRDLKRCRALWKSFKPVVERSVAGPGTGRAQDFAGAPAVPSGNTVVPAPRVPKIIFAPYQHFPAFTYDQGGSYAISGTLLAIPRNDPVLAGILNSTLGRFLITSICKRTDRGYHLSPAHLGKFPVVTPDFDNPADKTRHDKMVALVTQMLSLLQHLQKAKTDQERRLVQQEIDATDVRIDALVYELYGLTKEEIDVVEERLMMQ
jgi:hypothetical protein